jgi:hypothetical protein
MSLSLAYGRPSAATDDVCFWDAPTSEMEGMASVAVDAPPPPEPRVTGAEDPPAAEPAAPAEPVARDLSAEQTPDDEDPRSPLMGEAESELDADELVEAGRELAEASRRRRRGFGR